jgi:HEAT repeat protein
MQSPDSVCFSRRDRLIRTTVSPRVERASLCVSFSCAVRRCACGMAVVVMLSTLAAGAAEVIPALDAAFQALAQLEVGQSLLPLAPIEQALRRAHGDPTTREDLERRLAAILRGDTTDAGKDYACRQLAIVGSDSSAPIVATLLTNPRLAYMARYALEGIGTSAAIKELREALVTTNGPQKVGVVVSLGRLSDADAESAIGRLLGQKDSPLVEAAVIALGRIGTASSADVLARFAETAPASFENVITNARLDAAERLCSRDERREAIRVYKELQSSESENSRAAAYRGLIDASPSDSAQLIISGLAASESWKRAAAADCIREVRTNHDIQTIAKSVSGLPIPGRVAALASLKGRSDPVLRDAALASLTQLDSELRIVALDVLIEAGLPPDVPQLARLASSDTVSEVRDAATRTLKLMTAEGTNQAVITLMSDEKTLNTSLVDCALGRRSSEFVPAFLRAAESSVETTGLKALNALEIMASPTDADALVRLLRKTQPGSKREAAGRAFWMCCQQISDASQRSAPLITAMENAEANGQCAILPVLARLGGKDALKAVRKAMSSQTELVRDAGHRALANWPDATVANELLDIAQTSKVASYRIWSLRAYARVVSLPSERPPQQTFEMLTNAVPLATRREDRELFMERFGAVRTPDALTYLLSCLDDSELKTAAVPAVFTLAKGLSQTHPEIARTALERIQSMTKDDAMLQQIPRVLRDIEARETEEITNSQVRPSGLTELQPQRPLCGPII